MEPPKISGSDEYDPLSPKRRFSWRIFVVAAVGIVGLVAIYTVIDGIGSLGFGIVMGLCAVVAGAIAAPNAYSESWAKNSMIDGLAELSRRKDDSSKDV
jgi:hypothetical protein